MAKKEVLGAVSDQLDLLGQDLRYLIKVCREGAGPEEAQACLAKVKTFLEQKVESVEEIKGRLDRAED